MCDIVRINLSSVDNEIIETLKSSSANNIDVTNTPDNSVQLQIDNLVDDNILMNALNQFINTIKEANYYKLASSWFFDENRALIKSPDKKFSLTQKEVNFLKMLLNNEHITTYEEIISVLWDKEESVTQNAIRLFTKNIRKKLPPKVLKNFQGIGYKLVL